MIIIRDLSPKKGTIITFNLGLRVRHARLISRINDCSSNVPCIARERELGADYVDRADKLRILLCMHAWRHVR